MDPYEVLGLQRSASRAEVRAAYLRLARHHHPDRHAASSPAERAEAERQMRRVNEAWYVLGDLERRRRYDATIERAARPSIVEPDGSVAWQPHDTGPDPFDDRLDDSRRPAPRGGRLLSMGPPTVLLGGILTLVLGLALGWRGLVALGAMGLILGVALFVVASLSVIAESRRNDLR